MRIIERNRSPARSIASIDSEVTCDNSSFSGFSNLLTSRNRSKASEVMTNPGGTVRPNPLFMDARLAAFAPTMRYMSSVMSSRPITRLPAGRAHLGLKSLKSSPSIPDAVFDNTE